MWHNFLTIADKTISGINYKPIHVDKLVKYINSINLIPKNKDLPLEGQWNYYITIYTVIYKDGEKIYRN